ncbi:MAG: SAM-dependent methyltransferase, partial [Pseudomonadota bacterium]
LFDFMAESLATNDGTRSVTRTGGLAFSLGETVKSIQEFGDTNEDSLDLVTSVFGLHWHNNLPAMLEVVRKKLKPDGLFLAALPGDRTLNELRNSFIEAETEISGNVSLRVDPFGEVRQYGSLLQRAGFALPVVDSEVFTVRYDTIEAIIRDLRAWGGSGSLQTKPAPLTKQMVLRAGEIYRKKYADADGRLRATYEIVYLHGWKPHSSQQKPLKPGSATTHLSKVLGDSGLK